MLDSKETQSMAPPSCPEDCHHRGRCHRVVVFGGLVAVVRYLSCQVRTSRFDVSPVLLLLLSLWLAVGMVIIAPGS